MADKEKDKIPRKPTMNQSGKTGTSRHPSSESTPNGVIRMTHDIPDGKRMGNDLGETERSYRSLVENMPDVIFSTDKDGNIFHIHLPAATFYGYESQEIISRSYTSFIFGEDIDSVRTKVKQALRHHWEFTKGVQYRVVSKEGLLNWVEANLHMQFDPQGVCIRTDVIIRDIGDLKKAEAELRQSNRELKRAIERRRSLSKRLIELLEKDRRQIAMELHDRMGQSLSVLRTGFSAIARQLEKPDGDILELVKSVEEKTVQELLNLKNISYELRMNMLDHLGLVPSIRTLITDFENSSNLRIRFFTKDIPREIDPDKLLALYRIAQEALINIVRHAHATDVYISLIKQDNKVLLSVEDNGIGYDKQDMTVTSDGKGLLGIYIMKERAVQVGGECMIESQIAKGTQVITEVPL